MVLCLGLELNAELTEQQSAVDIEVAVHGSSLDVGVFGPSDVLGAEDARRVIEGVVETLREAT